MPVPDHFVMATSDEYGGVVSADGLEAGTFKIGPLGSGHHSLRAGSTTVLANNPRPGST